MGAPTEFKWKDENIPEDKVPEWIPERIGKTVEVKLVNRPTGWNSEDAVWRDICVKANSAND